MERYEGKSIYNGIAIGKIWFYEKSEHQVKRVKIDNADDEIKRYEKAKECAIAQLNQLYEKAVTDVGEANAMIFEVHAMMLSDADYNIWQFVERMYTEVLKRSADILIELRYGQR